MHRRSDFVAAFLVFVLVAIGSAQDSQSKATMERIVEKLSSSQKAVNTLRYTWVQRVIYPKGTLTIEGTQGAERMKGPAEDTAVENFFRVVVDGGKLRKEISGMSWHVNKAQFVPSEETCCYAGDKSKRYNARLNVGVIDQRNESTRDFANAELAPIICAYRLFDPSLGLAKPDEVRLAGEAEHEGHKCVVIEKTFERLNYLVYRWTLAEDCSYRPVRFQSVTGDGQVLLDVSMRYEKDEKVEWRLASWASTYPLEKSVANVVRPSEVSFGDLVAPETFDMAFPSGTEVNDKVAHVVYTVGDQSESMHILASREPVSNAEVNRTVGNVRQNLNIPPPSMQVPRTNPDGSRHIPYAIIIGAVLVLLVVGIVVVTRNRKMT